MVVRNARTPGAVKILPPVKELPLKGNSNRVYTLILRRLARMENGLWLPVRAESKKRAHGIATNLKYARKLPLEVIVRDNILYIRKEQ